MNKKVTIVGGGVVGLTCAAVLATNHDVTVISNSFGVESPSIVATAIWHIYLVDPNDQQTLGWSKITLEKLLLLSQKEPQSGVHLVNGIELFRRGDEHLPSWHHIPPYFQMLTQNDLIAFPGVRWGYRISAPVAEMSKYLGWLYERCISSGVKTVQRNIRSIDEAFDFGSIVINCTGFGARELLGDESLIPVRGQYLVVRSSEGAPLEYIGDDHHPDGTAYVIPRQGDLCIGGTEEYGEFKIQFTETIEGIRKRAGEFVPWVRNLDPSSILKKVVGLRPYRQGGVRLECEYRNGGRVVIHNYGHGGSGFSLAWGCAERVMELVTQSSVLVQP